MPQQSAAPATAPAPAAAPATAAGSAGSGSSANPAAGGAPQPVGAQKTRLRFERGFAKPGIETLRVVRRSDTTNIVAGQVAIAVVGSILSGGIATGGSSFSKNDLAGAPIDALQGSPLAVNPAMSDLNDALSEVATRIYRKRTEEAHALALTDGSTPEEIAEAAKQQEEADTPLYPGRWHLVYENLAGDVELYRLSFGAQLGRAGFMRPPQTCGYQSEPAAWTQWQADGWQLLKAERAKAVAACAAAIGAAPEKFW